MQLPRELAPWAEELALFPADVQVSLGPMVQRLAALVGPLAGRQAVEDGHPDGFDGVARRGPMERLLASQWLLLQEAPNEFLRRHATGELAFLQLARTTESGRRTSVLLMDAGPEQWGTPRLAQVALVVVMARRARAAGVPFAFGILQAPRMRWETVDVPSLQALFQARATRPARAEDLAEWRTALGEAEQADDAWVAGAENTPVARGMSRVIISEPLRVDDRSLRVSIPSGANPRHAVVPVPNEQACVRIFRRPFQELGGPVGELPGTVHGAIQFSASGRMLLWRTRDGGLAAAGLHAQGGRPRAWRIPLPPGVRVGAAVFQGKLLHVVGHDDAGQGTLWTFARHWRLVDARPLGDLPPTLENARLGEAVACPRNFGARAIAALNAGGAMAWVGLHGVRTEPGTCLGLARRGDRIVAAVREADGLTWLTAHGGGGVPLVRVPLGPGVVRVMPGHPMRTSGDVFHLCAWQRDEQRWTVRWRGAELRFELAPGLAVFGVVEDRDRHVPRLVAKARDGHALLLVDPRLDVTRIPLRTEAHDASLSPDGNHVACVGDGGSVTLISLESRSEVWRLEKGAP